ncbi:MAG: polyprenyl synthetase family protein [Patescibacteria group bacterium]
MIGITMAGLKNFLKQNKEAVQKTLSLFFDGKIIKAVSHDPNSIYTKRLNQLKTATCQDGKVIRSAIAALSFGITTNKSLSQAELEAISALELLHRFLLIHDDIADEDTIRYSKPNLIAQIQQEQPKKGVYALSSGMILGDLDHSFMYETILNTSLNAQLKLKLIKKLGEIIDSVSLGWFVEYENSHKAISKTNLKKVFENLKYITSIYTTQGPAEYGLILANKDYGKTVKAFNKIMYPIGISYQIKDDLLGLFSHNIESGQEALSDIRQGKKTIHILKAYEKTHNTGKRYLEKIYGSNKVTHKDLDTIRELVTDSNAHTYTLDLAEKLIQDSKAEINNLPNQNQFTEILLELCDFVLERSN